MAKLGPEIAPKVKEVLLTNAGEIAGAFGRALGETFQVPADSVRIADAAAAAADFASAGLACVFHVNDVGALAFVPESSGLLPSWIAAPDASGANKLFTLALELGMVVLPEELMPGDYKAGRVESFQAVMKNAAAADAPSVAACTLKSAKAEGTFWLVWPVQEPSKAFPPPKPQPTEEEKNANAESASPRAAANATSASPGSPGAPRKIPAYESLEDGLGLLPQYTKSLLKIKVPVIVTLAATKQPVKKVLEIVPGSIIQFSKSCEDPLALEVGGQEIAVGEAVKVGEKFGLRVSSMVLPEERFETLRGKFLPQG